MKKILIYILIAGIFLGAFAPAQTVEAQAGLGGVSVRDSVAQATGAPGPASGDTGNQLDLGCTSIANGSLLSCMARFVHFAFVSLPSLLASVAAKMFDFIAGLTLSNKLYEYEFIETIWGVVRDFSNIAFILVLLFAAFQTILGLGHGGAKKTIAAVVIMALLVNFSLFFTRAVIDAGNILGLVFYNKITVENDPKMFIANPDKTGVSEKSISLAIVSKFDIAHVLNASDYQRETTGSGLGTGGAAGVGCGVGAILGLGVGCVIGAVAGGVLGALLFSAESYTSESLLLMMGVMVAFGIILFTLTYAFVIAGLSLLGRFITLVMLMIVSPFAFVSYAIPGLKKMNRVGFDSWLHSLLSSSFMAAIFLFIIYIVAELMNANPFKEMAAGNLREENMLGYLVVAFLPAILIAMLLLAAAKYARKASGEFSEKIIGGAKMLAGVAIGGAALSTGVAGRAVIGSTTAAMSRTKASIDYGKKFDESRKGLGPKPKTYNPVTWMGGRINAAQLKSGRVSHEVHDWEQLKKDAELEGVSNRNLSGVDYINMEKKFVEKKRSDIERDIRQGQDDKKNPVLMSGHGIVGAQGEDDYKLQRRRILVPAGTTLSKEDEKRVENQLNKEVNEIIRATIPVVGEIRFKNLQKGVQEKIPMRDRVLARTTSGSYDPRNVLNIKPDGKTSFPAKAAAGLIAAVAAGIRLGMKSGGVSMGTPKRDFIADLKDVVGESLKKVDVKVDVKHDSGSKKDDQGTSGGGHH